jgi:hypothetical protein
MEESRGVTYIPVLENGLRRQKKRRPAMSGKNLLAAIMALGVLGTASAAWAWDYYWWRKGGFVIPCSLVGVNPIRHPDIFGNPAVAREIYGFVRSRDGTWQVEKNCLRGPYHSG